MRLRSWLFALCVLASAAHCQSTGGTSQTADGAVARDLAMSVSTDFSSAPVDAGTDGAGGGPTVRTCARSCISGGDCSMGTPAFDADNYRCMMGSCVYKGCNTDDECKSTFANSAYICRPIAGVPTCVKGCATVADCNLGSAAFDADNYSCAAGYCDYKGCNNDAECQSSFANSTYVCRKTSALPMCGKGCTTAADCNLGSAAFDADNYNCTSGICDYKGCNNDDECKSTYSNSEYVCG